MDSKAEQLEWIRALCRHLGISASELARRARLRPSTLNRPLNDPDFTGMLSGRSIAAIAEAAGVRPLEFPGRPRGFSDNEAIVFDHGNSDVRTSRAVRELIAGRNGLDAWTVRTRALDREGIMPGDIMIVNLNRRPDAGDIVCAQVYDWAGQKAETVFRVYEPPFLLVHSASMPLQKPLMVDDENVVIRGSVDATLRNLVH